MGNFDGSKGLEFQAPVLGFRLYGWGLLLSW